MAKQIGFRYGRSIRQSRRMSWCACSRSSFESSSSGPPSTQPPLMPAPLRPRWDPTSRPRRAPCGTRSDVASSSWCVPSATATPSASSTTRSASAIVAGRWAMMIVVRPDITSPSAERISCSFVGSTDEVASSRISTFGSAMTARAIAMRWRCPPDSENPCSPISVSYPSGRASMNALRAGEPGRAPRSASCDASGSANAMFSRTVSEKRKVSSKTMPIDFRSSSHLEVPHVDAVEQHCARRRRRRSAAAGGRPSSCRCRSHRPARPPRPPPDRQVEPVRAPDGPAPYPNGRARAGSRPGRRTASRPRRAGRRSPGRSRGSRAPGPRPPTRARPARSATRPSATARSA